MQVGDLKCRELRNNGNEISMQTLKNTQCMLDFLVILCSSVACRFILQKHTQEVNAKV